MIPAILRRLGRVNSRPAHAGTDPSAVDIDQILDALDQRLSELRRDLESDPRRSTRPRSAAAGV